MDKQTKTRGNAGVSQSDSSKLLAVRPLQFRAWDGETFYYFDLDDPEKISLDYLETFLRLPNKQQFTGKLDTHGRKIFEGDIYTTEGGVYVVFFKKAAFMLKVVVPALVSAEIEGELIYIPDVCTGLIIGNIIENLDLIEKHS